MIALVLTLIILAPITFLTGTIQELFSPAELSRMGIHLDNNRV